MGSMMQDLAFAIPGVDEAMSFAEIMKFVHPSLLTAQSDGWYFQQTRKIYGILCYRLRYRPNRTYPSFPLLPHSPREGTREAQLAWFTVWAHDQPGLSLQLGPSYSTNLTALSRCRV